MAGRNQVARSEGGAQSDPRKDWCTPVDFLTDVRRVLGQIDFDPCSNPTSQTRAIVEVWHPETYAHVQAPSNVIRADGLALEWPDCRWYCNHPFGRAENPLWSAKCHEAGLRNTGGAVVLTPACPGTKWWARTFWNAPAVCFLGRLQFIGALSKSDFELAAIYYGRHRELFASVFAPRGKVVFP